jgi:hypothetical protein
MNLVSAGSTMTCRKLACNSFSLWHLQGLRRRIMCPRTTTDDALARRRIRHEFAKAVEFVWHGGRLQRKRIKIILPLWMRVAFSAEQRSTAHPWAGTF